MSNTASAAVPRGGSASPPSKSRPIPTSRSVACPREFSGHPPLLPPRNVASEVVLDFRWKWMEAKLLYALTPRRAAGFSAEQRRECLLWRDGAQRPLPTLSFRVELAQMKARFNTSAGDQESAFSTRAATRKFAHVFSSFW